MIKPVVSSRMSARYEFVYVAAVVVDGIVRTALRATTLRVGVTCVRVEPVRVAVRATTRRDCVLVVRGEFVCFVAERATTRRDCVLTVRGEFVCVAVRARDVRVCVLCD